MVTCASPSYLKEMGTPKSLDDLLEHWGVTFQSGTDRRPMPWLFAECGEDKNFYAKGRISVNEANTYVQCGLAGFGIIQPAGLMVGRQLAEGSLIEILHELRPKPKPITLIYPSSKHVAPQVKAFAEWLASNFSKLQPEWLGS